MTTFECFDNFLFLSKVYLILKLLTKFVEVENVFFLSKLHAAMQWVIVFIYKFLSPYAIWKFKRCD